MAGSRDSDEAFEDLLWELDVTSVRPTSAAGGTTGLPQAPPIEPRSVQPRGPRPVQRTRLLQREERARFARPELSSLGERLAGNRVVQGFSGAVLLGGTSILVVIALSRG